MSAPTPVIGMRSSPRILIADDHEVMRLGLRLLMERKNWKVCGEATNGREAISKVQELAPDVIILDLTMPVMNGYEAVREIRLIAPAIKIVFFTMHDMPVTARQVGADAFVTKSQDPKEVIAAIERLMGLNDESNPQ